MDTAAPTDPGQDPDARHIARPGTTGTALLLIVLAVLAISAIFVAVTPAEGQTTLEGRTWAEFAAGDPEVARLFSMQLSLTGIIDLAFVALAAMIALGPYRGGQRWAWLSLWLVPATFAVVAVRMLTDAYDVGILYVILAVVATIALLLPARTFLGSAGSNSR